jgi:hypothetical protein
VAPHILFSIQSSHSSDDESVTGTLSCLIEGTDPDEELFDIENLPNIKISLLKNAIKRAALPDLSVIAKNLELWKIDAPYNNVPSLNDIPIENKMAATKVVSDYWKTSVPTDCINILIRIPTGK